MTDSTKRLEPGYRRQLASVKKINGSTHAGLWFDRYLLIEYDRDSTSAAAQKNDLIKQTAALAVPTIYVPSMSVGKRNYRAMLGLLSLKCRAAW